jgi:hypothetical protein
MSRDLRNELLDRHQVRVTTDSSYQAGLRLQQALWRESQGLDPGVRPKTDQRLGSMLTDADAKAGHNYVDPEAVELALKAVSSDALVDRTRLQANLLASQPLAFNLFASLAIDLDAATRVFRHLLPHRITRVTRICFEHSPGRGVATYLENGSAFDVFVEYASMDGGKGFVGIEVKYHEDLRNQAPANKRDRYQVVAERAGCFRSLDELYKPPLWQLWLDHLLALAMVQGGEYDDGAFVLLAPAGNKPCRYAASTYATNLLDGRTFLPLSLEEVLAAVTTYCDGDWVLRLWERYGDAGRLARAGWPALR